MSADEIADEIAADIRDELVCCDVYERTAHLRDELVTGRPGFGEALDELDDAIGEHTICYWGEAARIAEDRAGRECSRARSRDAV